MTNSQPDRLDRIERLVESNARAIEASSNERTRYEQENQLNRNRLYQAMANMSSAIANMSSSMATMATTHAEFQTNIYNRQQELDERQQELSRRQGEIVELLRAITEKVNNSDNT